MSPQHIKRQQSLEDKIALANAIVSDATQSYGPGATAVLAEAMGQSEFVDQIYALVTQLPQRFSEGQNSLTFSTGETVDFFMGEEGVESISHRVEDIQGETRLELAKLYNTLRLTNYAIEEMSDPDLCKDASNKEKSTAVHLRRVGEFAEEVSEDIEDNIEAIRFYLSARGHDVGKMISEILSLPNTQNLTEEEMASIYEHSSYFNKMIQAMPDELARFIAYAHHSMSQKRKDELAAKGIIINIVSHEQVLEDAKNIPGISEEVVMKTLFRTKLIDAADALLSFRSYRAFSSSLVHALHEAMKKIAELDEEGRYSDFVATELAFFFRRTQKIAEKFERTGGNFYERQAVEAQIIEKTFDMSLAKLRDLLEDHSGQQSINGVLQWLIAKSGVELPVDQQNDKSLQDQWVYVCTQLGIHLRSNKDARLMREEDFIVNHSFSSEFVNQLQNLNYDQILSFFQQYEPKILEESRRDEYVPILNGIEDEQITDLLNSFNITGLVVANASTSKSSRTPYLKEVNS